MKKFSCIVVLVLFLCFTAEAGQIRVGVAALVDRTGKDIHENNSQTQMFNYTKVFTDILRASSSKIDVADSDELGTLEAMTIDNAVNAGKKSGCKYVVLGAMTADETDNTQNKTIYTLTRKVIFDIRLVDVQAGKIVFAYESIGEAKFTHDSRTDVSSVGIFGSNKKKQEQQMEQMTKELKETSSAPAKLASSMAAEKICAFLFGEHPEVTSTEAPKKTAAKKSTAKKAKNETASLGTVRINRGSNAGVNTNTIYKIFFDGEQSGNLAVAQVTSVKEDSCTAEVKAGYFRNIHSGDKAEQITKEEADALIKSGVFVKDRLF